MSRLRNQTQQRITAHIKRRGDKGPQMIAMRTIAHRQRIYDYLPRLAKLSSQYGLKLTSDELRAMLREHNFDDTKTIYSEDEIQQRVKSLAEEYEKIGHEVIADDVEYL
ncbi:hypothetical protein MMC14_006386, partial [Varicellaria rhodocarpa]|nr:hypothetical protein [Varicellaria rhodocarpa]